MRNDGCLVVPIRAPGFHGWEEQTNLVAERLLAPPIACFDLNCKVGRDLAMVYVARLVREVGSKTAVGWLLLPQSELLAQVLSFISGDLP